MRRRDFIPLIGGVMAWPLAAVRAQSRPAVVGVLDPGVADLFDIFFQGMRDLGYVDGQNVNYVRYGAQGKTDRIPALASELVGRKPDVIFSTGPLPVRSLKAETATIPIVVVLGDVRSAGVTDFAHPGGNLTGFSFLNTELNQKRLELLHEAMPAARRIGLFYDPNSDPEKSASERGDEQEIGTHLQIDAAAEPRCFRTCF